MKILVTGSTGFIGAALCRRLDGLRHKVRAFHRATSSLRLLEGLEVEHVIGDLTQPETLLPALKGVEVVFHTGASLGGRDKPGQMYAVTVEGTRALLKAARRAGVRRVVHTSSVAALGIPEIPRRGDPSLMDENHSWNYRPDRWLYGYTKYLAELEVQRAVAQGLNAVMVNPSVVYGAGDGYRQDSSLVVLIAHQRLPVIVEAGLNVVHIDDVVDGHLAALERGRKGERYILGGQNLSIATLVKDIAAIVGKPAPVLMLPAPLVCLLARPARLLQPFISLPVTPDTFYLAGMHFFITTLKAQTQLGLQPPRPYKDALREAYEWFKQVGAIH